MSMNCVLFLFFLFWLLWVFLAARGLSLDPASWGHALAVEPRLPLEGAALAAGLDSGVQAQELWLTAW